ncbi:MAG: DUF4365 domain-containing protein [Proteobacteria bacterium]|nr:DUF4365 domain-containing protein [Desulfocapsa sp.]MBU3944019.1 DUF4365 domain-containing protein [Pseudomonadota bacterium]MCG2745560.1 DUF4365 domain-containing protein [Desulfobacteraceae bacterium]MBU4029488.1 DUF4365 domain-containing protein [Pseudomonadota bacterium]MBU4043264.1 DUF4365 domain-containing protein [Pseudomonadota bacterium]
MRTETHIIDSRAVKTVIGKLPHHWVVRELSERDYGIDLMVEIFAPGFKDAKGKDAFAATGSVFHIQIKGVDKPLQPVRAGTINYCIDTKSLAYVEKFSIPFFLFRVSVADPPKVYFLWIQRYIKDVMDRKTPLWREDEQSSITVRIPPENELLAGIGKIEKIAFRPKYLEELAEFAEVYGDIGNRIDAIRAGTHDVNDGIISDLKYRAFRARRLNVLLTRNECCIDRQSVDALIQYITNLDTADGRNQPIPDAHNFEMLANSIAGMDLVENFVLENDGLLAY